MEETVSSASTPVDSQVEVVDSHYHWWLKPHQRYFVDDFERDLASSGHPVVGGLYVECHSMYRRSGPDALKSVGEAQFYSTEMARSGISGGGFKAGFVGAADLMLGDDVDSVLDGLAAESQERLKGIRGAVYWDADPTLNLGLRPYSPQGLLLNPTFRRGFKRLADRGLVYDAWQYEPQLPELCSLADAFPYSRIVVNHCGGPLGINAYATSDRFDRWKLHIKQVALRPNTFMKLSGLTAPRIGLPLRVSGERPTAAALSQLWKPYIEVCIEAFGADRCLFGSNFPVDLAVCDYGVLIDAYKLANAAIHT